MMNQFIATDRFAYKMHNYELCFLTNIFIKWFGYTIAGTIQIGGAFLQSSFSILEDQPMDMLLGLDMLKRHQVNGILAFWILCHTFNEVNGVKHWLKHNYAKLLQMHVNCYNFVKKTLMHNHDWSAASAELPEISTNIKDARSVSL